MPTLCKHAENRHACTRCRDDEIERLRGELLLITQLQAGDGSTVNGLTKDQLGRAFRQAQDIARAALGIVTHGDSISGSVNPDQPPAVLHDNKANVSVRCPDCDDGAYKGTDRICLTCNGLGELRRATFPTPPAQPIAVTGNCGLCGQPRADHAEVAPDGKPECRMKENSHHE